MMRVATGHYWIRAGLVGVGAFLLGVVAYIFTGIMIANGAINANAAHQQIVVRPLACTCILRFAPEHPMEGIGAEHDPYVTYNSRVPVIIGAAGAGHITIKDRGNILHYSYEKSSTEHEEITAVIDLPERLGIHVLEIELNGGEVEVMRSGAQGMVMHIDYRALPLPPEAPAVPGVPNTGAVGGYLYVGGYAVQTFGAMTTGLLFGVLAMFGFVLVAVRRRRQEARISRSNAALGKRIRREFSMRAIEKSGVARKSRLKRRR